MQYLYLKILYFAFNPASFSSFKSKFGKLIRLSEPWSREVAEATQISPNSIFSRNPLSQLNYQIRCSLSPRYLAAPKAIYQVDRELTMSVSAAMSRIGLRINGRNGQSRLAGRNAYGWKGHPVGWKFRSVRWDIGITDWSMLWHLGEKGN